MADDLYIGIMSGTSVDAIDCALLSVEENSYRIDGTYSAEIPGPLRDQILSLSEPGGEEIDRMGVVDRKLGERYAEAVHALLRGTGHHTNEIAAIGCHGQTIRHRPEQALRFTLQIGDPNVLVESTGITVVTDFRRRDMALGGQGAPLAPAFHAAAFAHPDANRAIVNIGGMANITVLRKACAVTGYDTGPGNVLLDLWYRAHHQARYDRDGQWAASGRCVQPLLQQMLKHPFFSQRPPKSTGRELFNSVWLHSCLDEIDLKPDPADVQATLLELTASSIARCIDESLPRGSSVHLCGGGALNEALRTRLATLLGNYPVTTTQLLGIDPEWVEACAFAWLAYRTLNGLPGNLAEVTGASRATVLGGIYRA